MKTVAGLAAVAAVLAGVYALIMLPGSSNETVTPPTNTDAVSQFETIEEASEEAGFALKQPALPDWSPMGTIIVRKAETDSGTAVTVNAAFEQADRSIALTIEQSPAQHQPEAGDVQPVAVRGTNGLLRCGSSGNSELVILSWREGGLAYQASTLLETWSVEDFLAAIESLA